jgi:uncharacterized Zn finger protein
VSWWGEEGLSHRRPPARGTGARRRFGSTWWSRAWLAALTERARLDPNRLSRGRGYARSGAVGELDVGPGEVRAAVQGSRRQPYQVRVRLRQLPPPDWDRLLDVMAAEVGRAAALLDGELPPEIEGEAAAAGIDVLPGAGELGLHCSCPDWASPCKHVAAVCFVMAERLDADPFELLLLRGRDRDQVLAGIRARRRAAGTGDAAPARAGATGDAGMGAAEAYAAWAALRPADLPSLPLPPLRPGRPVLGLDDAPTLPARLADDLEWLAADAALRAWSLATADPANGASLQSVPGIASDHTAVGTASGTELDVDVARIAASALGTPRFDVLARRLQLSTRELARRAIAWQHGGPAAVDLLLGGGAHLDAAAVADAKQALGPGARARGRAVTRADVQLRRGRDGQWYGLCRRHGGWETAGAPDPSPVVAAERARRA